MLPVYGIMRPSIRLNSARPPGSGLSLAHSARTLPAGEAGFDISGCYRRAEKAASADAKAATGKIGGRFEPSIGTPLVQTFGGIVSVTVCPGWMLSELLIGAALEPIGSIRNRTVFAGPMM